MKRFKARHSVNLRHEINVTPFVDVMLVLLIIFMVATPMMQAGVEMDLPKSSSQATELSQDQLLTLSLDKEGTLFLKEKKIPISQLIPTLKSFPRALTEKIFIRADRQLPYERVMALLSLLAQEGFSKITLVTDKTEAQ
jgi:biopolymer transport protein TolR